MSDDPDAPEAHDAPGAPDAPDRPHAEHQARSPSVFLSYASEDREAARVLRDSLPGFGIEVWYDESELGGGEAWDQKIRRQIRECDYFIAIVSAQTQARLEGYFRREWRLAVERTLDMADDHLFLLPILIDDTDQAQARVPEKFFTVQWLKVPGGRPNRALESLCRRLTSGDAKAVTPVRTAKAAKAVARRLKPIVPPPQLPGFPVEEPGQRVRFWVEVFVWGCRSSWMLFNRLPKWLRVAAYFWLVIAFFSDVRSSRHEESSDISAAKMAKLKTISDNYHGSLNKKDVASLGAQIAKEFSDDSDDSDASTDAGPLLAVPFTAPPGDMAAEKLANAAFAMTYGMVSISHHGQVNLTKDPLPSRELGAALERGRASHATYVLYGTVDPGNAQRLTVKIATVADGSIVWSKSYPAEGADPAAIASEVDGKIPALPAK